MPPRTLVVVEAQGAPVDVLARALGLSALEAQGRAERGGLHLLRVAAPDAAREEGARLQAAGLAAWLLDEAAVRAAARPRFVRGGSRAGGGLRLVAADAPIDIRAEEVRLVVRGPIQREYQTLPGRVKVRAATLEPGYRVHLHLRDDAPPLEIDPGDFAFTDPADAGSSSLIAIARWVEELRAPLDDEFRRRPPALGAAAPAAGALSLVEALRPVRAKDAPLVLDNLEQFRFYSAWRGLVERERTR
jgi:hypothetical protein